MARAALRGGHGYADKGWRVGGPAPRRRRRAGRSAARGLARITQPAVRKCPLAYFLSFALTRGRALTSDFWACSLSWQVSGW